MESGIHRKTYLGTPFDLVQNSCVSHANCTIFQKIEDILLQALQAIANIQFGVKNQLANLWAAWFANGGQNEC